MENIHDNLSDRLNQIPRELKDTLVETLLGDYQHPGFYFKDDRLYKKSRDILSFEISEYLNGRGVDIGKDFPNKLYLSFTAKKGEKSMSNRAPLFRIIDGQVIGDKVDDDIFFQLNGWEAIYFLVGLYHCRTSGFVGDRYTKTRLNAWSVPEIVAYTIEQGIKKLQKYEKNLIKKLPHKDQILEACRYVRRPQMDLFK